ncbi:MAG TPA: PAS domain S-box protein, partial [Candidatus Ozemobacteraceae bacterium]|nr:PAS domain S-box protein [Candidatus Ozemobacteraceae bacterium]
MDVTAALSLLPGALLGGIGAALATAWLVSRHFHRRLAEEARTSDLERFHCQKTAEAFVEREKHFREFVEFLPQAVIETDLDGKFIYINQKAGELLRFTPVDLATGVSWVSICHSSHLDRLWRYLKDGTDGGTGDEYLLVKKDGTTFPALLYCHRVLLSGAGVGFRFVLVDISARRHI